ncbi:FAD-dependent oxidoreductase [Mycobacterium spongiae]|uniref:FAD-binding protein n=1 Tax=Mycobacterium spongiae TaxID=886343 RepID=A0A975K339_9MYCO|nr:FAD-dependent oxidoreductase [Mycobacterium spongiae]QUR69604.1 FAD-binding protein [Mycobacterium spongiae]
MFLRGAAGALVTTALSAAVPARANPGGWSSLDSSIGGRVLLPNGGASFTRAKRVFNSLYDTSTPAAVVTVTSLADVQRAVTFAAANKLTIAPRGGGHSYIGASTADGAMVLDLRGLPGGVRFDSATGDVTVPAATGLYAVHQALAGPGRAIPTGSCPTVGTAGLALGGGLGADSRHAGLTCDALTSATVVLPNGDAITASADDHPDLFWALRGGGGGNFGVTTSMTFATFPTADSDVVRVDFPAQAAAHVLTGWQTWLAAADRNTWGLVDFSTGSGRANCHVLATCPAGSGPDAAAAIKAAVGLRPNDIERRTLRFMDLVTYLAGGSATSTPRGFVAGSDVIGVVDASAADAIVAAMRQWPPGAGRASVIVDTLTGAVGDVDPGGSAFPWRRQAAVAQWYVETPSGERVSTATTWLKAAHREVQPFSVGRYVNYREANTPVERYFGPNLPRLAAVQRKYDPDRVICSGLDL